MFQSADIVVKSVMAGLGLSSVVTWTIALAKIFELWGAKRLVTKGLNALAQSESLEGAAAHFSRKNTIVSRLISGAVAEAERSAGLSPEGIKERATALLQRIEARGARVMTRGTGILASIGSTAPFIGLFGTVWGIMNSFIGISQTNTTNLAVVAPGIAEALLATASGLVAAIPAVIIYNALARSIAGYKASLGDVTAEVLRHLSRDLDRGGVTGDGDSWPEAKLRQNWRLPTRQSAE
jgi:biopolymer transport protein ExbB